MRDTDRLKEKIEVSLDNRQIFYLFFGSAVVAGLVFVIGVLVGKRLEARKAKPQATPNELTLIDRDAKLAAKELTFHQELIKPDARTRHDVPPEVLDFRDMGQGGHSRVGASQASPAARRSAAATRVRRLAPAGRAPAPRPSASSTMGSGSASEQPPTALPVRASSKRYTLQVSAFQTRGEAVQMIKKLESRGYRPYIVSSHLPERGVWYRVRLGSFGTWKKALEAKKVFEDKLQMTAYVSRR